MTMSKYLVKASYNAKGIEGLLKEGGTERRKVVEKLAAELGGKVEAFYYSFGEHDVYVITDLPDNVTAAALGLKINSSGVVSITTTVLITPEEIDEAAKKTISYRAPGAQ